MSHKFLYQNVLDLGFVRKDLGDSVFFSQNGYDWFIVTMKLAPRIHAEWDSETHEVQLTRYDKKHNILGRMPIVSMLHLQKMIEFFGKEKSKSKGCVDCDKSRLHD